MKIAIFSATQLGLRCVETLLNLGEEIVGIFTIPREFKISYSPDRLVTNVRYVDFKEIGRNYLIPVVEVVDEISKSQYEKILKGWAPDFILVAGWYHMVPRLIRYVPRFGCAGFHASLLPKYSGGAPITWAIINGERQTGLTFFYLDEGIDNGDIIAQEAIPIDFSDTVKDILEKVESKACDILKETVPLIKTKEGPRIPQDDEDRTIFPQRRPEDGLIDWNNSAVSIYNFIRAQTHPYPGAFTSANGQRLTVWESKIYDSTPDKRMPGHVFKIVTKGATKGMSVTCGIGDSSIILTKVQIGDKIISGLEFDKQKKIIGTILGK